MAKRRLLLNEDQLNIDITDPTNVFVQSHPTLVSKITANYTGINVGDTFSENLESLINDSNLVGSRSFVAADECAAGSVYLIKGRATYNMGGEGIASSFSVRFSAFGTTINPLNNVTGPSSSTEEYDVDFEIVVGFTVEATVNKMYVRLKFDYFAETGQAMNARSNDHSASSITISGTSSFDILAGLKYGGQARTNYITCKKLRSSLVTGPSTNTGTFKWIQTSTVTGVLGNQLLVPNSGSLVFTPAQMTTGKKYRVIIKHWVDDPLAGNVNFDIKIGGNSFSSITTLTNGNGPSNHFDFILEFRPSTSEVYMFITAVNDSLAISATLFATFNSTVNQSIEVIANTASLAQSIIYSTCEILN